MKLNNMETPALIVDMDLLEENARIMNKILEKSGISLRPHYKSHKCPHLAHLQIKLGAKGITCAKLSEAEDLILSGIDDVLIANQITMPSKISRVAYLAGCCHLTVCVDKADNIAALETAAAFENTTIHCLVEYEIGMNRCGVKTPEEFLALAKQIESSPHLFFEGIQAYAGNNSHELNYEVRKGRSEESELRIRELIDYVKRAGLTIKEVSGDGTGTAEFRKPGTVYTEVQAGSHLFMDQAYGAMNLSFKSSLFLLVQVINISGNWVITDGGRKSISVDSANPIFRDYPNVPIRVNDEHSLIPLEHCRAAVGDRLLMVPAHVCTAFNLHDWVYLVRNEKVIDRVPITSRGKSI